ncbi:rRNA maturation RNase YbeY [Anaerofustis stercorihominis]|uniref:Endoribonuclease YbeY n=2 Tax=Anaerofustis stercorihominis TaxID=214853 RepID=B1C5L9_9FIRM|nr:rRNA maturation RNase YbeY [Anaerofustis stercorihominis]EDS73651.1 translation metalloprotein YbeY [Anaerofustis stercorihominis DSM 17244]MCQ4795556.1 rRNA maturation RNase YbeY [Anaerofustis stercorihominis]RGD72861.1 rRNA maturation RNase YbeY [Anaerofustis stercorihominis]
MIETEVLFDNRSGKDVSEETYNKIQLAINKTLEYENFKKPSQVSVSLVNSEEIKTLNNYYRNIDKTTDVLSFPMDDDEFEDEVIILGDVVLCLDKAKEQAIEFGHSLDREICYLTVHSTLHLLGFDHMEEEEKKEMREHEEKVMDILDLPRE